MTVAHDPPLVLIADDQIPTTIMLERVFQYEGYQVTSVYDGIAAVEKAREALPNLILLDVNMPGMNGFDVLRKLKEHPETEKIPTILVTAMGELSDIVQGLNLGADDYIRKPFASQELLARAQSKMRARQLEESLQRRTQELEALLRVSEELNQHLDARQLLDFILLLTLDLLPGEMAAIYRLQDDQSLGENKARTKNQEMTAEEAGLDPDQLLKYLRDGKDSVLWPDEEKLAKQYESGMAAPLRYGGETRGLLLLANNQAYDENHFRLFNAIAKQVTLALNNSDLYEIQANYALHLEDMVAERTVELQSAQQMLVRSEKLASIGRLSASIAHEINNPLFPLKINLEDMLEDIESGHAIRTEDVQRTLESVERIRRIVNQLLEFTGKRQSEGADAQPLDINSVLQSILTLNTKFFEQEGLSIETLLSPLPQIHGNKDQLEQVFMNLVLNAKAAMESGGVLKVSTAHDDTHVLVVMVDDGHGIPEDMVENIFEPFVSTKPDGTGLGLFISYGIVQNHNGQILVDSTVDVGTTFTIKLPISSSPAPTPPLNDD